MRQLRVENTLYNLSDDLWRQVNDLLGKAEGTKRLTQEMLKDEIPPETEGSDKEPPTEDQVVSRETADEAKPIGEDLADENKP